jgi:hypothetical protein
MLAPMTLRKPIDPLLHGRSFSTSDVLSRGVTRAQLRQPAVEHPFHGVNLVAPDAAPDRAAMTATQRRCRDYSARLLPGQFFAGSTAALLYRAPLPMGFDVRPLVVGVNAPRTPPRARGVRGIRVVEGRVQLRTGFGFAVVAPADAWCQLAGEFPREELVAVGDYLLAGNVDDGRYRRPFVTRAELEEAVRRHRGCRGATKLRWALARLREGVDSRPESLLRLLLVAAGVPEPLVNDPTDVGGGVVLRPDLQLKEWGVVFEYEGDDHRTSRRQWVRDQQRRELLEEAGWKVIRVFSVDLFENPAAFLQRVLVVLRSRGYPG